MYIRKGSLLVFSGLFQENRRALPIRALSSFEANRRVDRFQLPFVMLTASVSGWLR